MRTLSSRPLARTLGVAALAISLGGAAVAPISASAAPEASKANFVRGTIVNNGGNPVSGILVRVRDVDTGTDYKDVTNAMGVFRVDVPATAEEFSIRVNGRAEGFETGYLACNHTIVPTWGESCSQGAGRIGKYRIDRLR
jgi:hypothetical protein